MVLLENDGVLPLPASPGVVAGIGPNADSARTLWFVFEVKPDGTLLPGKILFDGTEQAKRRPGVADSLKVDTEGNIFAAAPGGLFVIAPDGTLLGRFDLGCCRGRPRPGTGRRATIGGRRVTAQPTPRGVVDLGYIEVGRGPALVAVHGGLLGGRLTFGPVLADWAQHLRVLVPDRRGFEHTPGSTGTIAEQARAPSARDGPSPSRAAWSEPSSRRPSPATTAPVVMNSATT